MAGTFTPEEKLAFLISCFHNNTNDNAIDFEAVAGEMGAKDKVTARRYFKTIVESSKKYDLTSDNKVVLKGEALATPASGKKRGRSKKGAEDTSSKTKKTKQEREDVVQEKEDDGVDIKDE